MSWEIRSKDVSTDLRERVARLVDTFYDYDVSDKKSTDLKHNLTERLTGIMLTLQDLKMIRPADKESFMYCLYHTRDAYGHPSDKEEYIRRVMRDWDGSLVRSENKETPQVREKGEKPAGSEERH